MKKVKILLLSVAISFGAISLAFKDDLFQVSKNIDIFVSLFKEININYVDETNAADLIKKGADAMLSSLDPYTEFVPSSEIENYRLKYVSTQYGGIGVSTITIDGRLLINEVSEGYPSQKAGLLAGDEITKINGIAVKDKERTQLSQLIRGPKGTTVDLTLKRENKEFQQTVVRDEIKQPNVSFSIMLDGNIGYIKLDKFLENSGNEVRDALKELLKHNPKGLILDLRNNGGGILQEAVKIINLFVAKDIVVVSQKGRNPEKNIIYRTIVEPLAPHLAMTVLINGNSASASEIVAGTLQDLDRAIVLGQRSYGKGLVQQTFNLPYNSLVKVTVAKYYTASGRCIQTLDYTHRNVNGKVDKFADSSITAYKTSSGRTVYDGTAVFPDIFIENQKLSPITITLASKNLFFDFANQFRKRHPNIVPAKQFRLSEADYQLYVNSLAQKEYTYISQTEKTLDLLTSEAEKENKTSSLKAELDLLRTKILNAKKNDLTLHQDEIKRLLETQIVSRYYFERGRVEQSFQYDKELAKATQLLNNQSQYLAILKGEGTYKTIGKPNETKD